MHILDFHPVAADDYYIAKYGAEPSLRELIFKYYNNAVPAITEEKAVEYANNYCEQISQYLEKA
jgi:hypothetical protein